MVVNVFFWGAAAALGWVYLGYPLLAAIAGRIRRVGVAAEGTPPTVTVAVSVYQGADTIEARVRDIFAQEASGARLVQVIIGDDGSTDGTGEIVARLAADEPRLHLLTMPRSGQTLVHRAMFAMATGDVVVLSDAETRFAPGCLAALGGVFTDPRIGCATGKLVWFNVDGSPASSSEGLYWRYELLIRKLESRAGWLTAVTGAILAVRRTAYRQMPPRFSTDELLPILVRETGSRVVYVPDAVAMDRPIRTIGEQFRGRARRSTRGIAGTLHVFRHSRIRTQPGPMIALVSHKLLRWATPWAVLVAAVTGLALAPQGLVYALAPAGLAALVALGGIADLGVRRGLHLPRAVTFARSVIVVNVAFALGWVNVARGRRYETWAPGGRAAEPTGAAAAAAAAPSSAPSDPA